MVLMEVTELVGMEALQELSRSQPLQTRAAMMNELGSRLKNDPAPETPDAPAEVDVFKPGGAVIFVETVQALQRGSPNHEARGGRLIDFLRYVVISIRHSIAGRPGIGEPDLIEQEHVGGDAGDGGKGANVEADLGFAGRIDEFARGCPSRRVGRQRLRESFHRARPGFRIRIEEEHVVAPAAAPALVISRGVAKI